jgi:hypothetical protein
MLFVEEEEEECGLWRWIAECGYGYEDEYKYEV